ncbi:MAG: ATP-binding protein [Phycisphaerales bacterium]
MSQRIERGRERLLHGEIRWLIRLRWVAGALVLAGGLANWRWLHWYDVGAGPVALGAVILVCNLACWAVLRRQPRMTLRMRWLLAFASVQIHLDLAWLTALVVWTGGSASPLLGAYFFHMLFASLLQPRVRAYGVAGAAVLLLSVGLMLTNQWPVSRHDRLVVAGWMVMMPVTVYLTDRVTAALYRRELTRVRQYERLHKMAARLRTQQAALVQGEKMAAMGEVAAGIAHEITNPLASMDSVLQLMERRPTEPKPESIALLREQVQRILRIVRQLTTYAHPGRGAIEVVSLNDVVRSSLEMLALNERARHVQVEANLPESVGGVAANPHTFQQVLTNILLNALDAVDGRPEPHIHVRTRRDDDHVVVEVSDNGSGIEQEHLQRIFEPFFTTKPVGRGTGLGLSICARLIREQRGRIDVASKVGEGTTFSIVLPAPRTATRAAGEVLRSAAASGGRRS